jgi:hypothetical protein
MPSMPDTPYGNQNRAMENFPVQQNTYSGTQTPGKSTLVEKRQLPYSAHIGQGIINNEATQLPCWIFCTNSVIKSTHPSMYFTMCKIGSYDPSNRNCIFLLVENKYTMYRILQNKKQQYYDEIKENFKLL